MSDTPKTPAKPSESGGPASKPGAAPVDKAESEKAEAVLRVEQDNRVRSVKAEVGAAEPHQHEGVNPDG